MASVNVFWVSRQISEKQFLLKYELSEQFYRIYLCNFTAVFEESMECQQVIQKNLELNPNIEMELDRLLCVIKTALESSTLKIVEETSDEIRMQACSTVGGVPFVWLFCTKLCKPSVLRDMLLSPLLGMVFELSRRQNQLVDRIKKKDAEIEDYKSNGAKVSRAYLETEKFQEASFLSTENVEKANNQDILNAVFSGSGQSLLKAVSEAASPVKVDVVKPLLNAQSSDKDITIKEESKLPPSSQIDLELKRRQDLEHVCSKEKVKKKKAIKF